jgi:NAD(P) transhydrogenase subunit alpha
MKIAIPKERRAHESRVAASPDTVKRIIALGGEVVVEKGAGHGANFTDDAYKAAGATIGSDVWADADVVLKVQRPIVSGKDAEIASLKPGTVVMAICDPYRAGDDVAALAKTGATVLAMDFVPRITRAQSMDVLSSQSNLAGYKAVLDAASEYASAFPMMMTAAGTVAPAKVLVMGAGVAGLQAIATAKRLGAVVSATDVRPAAKEQVESLGGSFVAVEDEEFKQAETAGGYAKEMSDAYKKKQADLTAETLKKMDIVITTALIPGRPAPILITAEMVKSMKTGSVIVDLAVENGGNCELSQPGKVVVKNGVKIVGHYNMPSRLAADASALYARNLFNLLQLIVDPETKSIRIDWEDAIIKGTCITRDGKIVHPALAPEEAAVAAPEDKAGDAKAAESATDTASGDGASKEEAAGAEPGGSVVKGEG